MVRGRERGGLLFRLGEPVSLVLEGFTTGFGMGPGGSPPLEPRSRVMGSGWGNLDLVVRGGWRRARRSTVSTAWLHTLRCLHLRPIYQVIFLGSSGEV